MEIRTANQIRISDNAPLKVTIAGGVIDVMQQERPTRPPEIIWSEDRKTYIIVATGEVRTAKKRQTRTDDKTAIDEMRKSMRRMRQLINANWSGDRNELMITLTYAECMTDPKRLKKDMEKWLKKSQETARRNKISVRRRATGARRVANKWSHEYVKFGKMITYVKAVFKFAILNNLIKTNPFDGVKNPAKHKTTEQHDLWTLDDLEHFLRACKADERAIVYPLFRVLAYTGLRRQEVLALTWSDLNGNLLTVNKALTVDYDNHTILGETKNESSNRVIGLDSGTVEALNEWRRLSTTSRILPIGVNRPYLMMQQIIQREGLPPCSPHKLRHLHCTVAIQSGADLKDVQERLGHSDIETTLRIYTHASKDKTVVADIFADTLKHSYTQATQGI